MEHINSADDLVGVFDGDPQEEELGTYIEDIGFKPSEDNLDNFEDFDHAFELPTPNEIKVIRDEQADVDALGAQEGKPKDIPVENPVVVVRDAADFLQSVLDFE